MPPLSPASEYATGLGHRDKGSWDATALLHMDTDLGVSQLLSMIKGGEGGVDSGDGRVASSGNATAADTATREANSGTGQEHPQGECGLW